MTIYSPPVNTYIPIGSYTLASATSEISLTGFSGYRDLILTADFQASTGGIFGMRFNGDNVTSYQRIYMIGDGTNDVGGTDTSFTYLRLKATGTFRTMVRAQINDYEQTDRLKTALIRSDSGTGAGGGETIATAGHWPKTTAITSIQCFVTAGTFDAAATFTLHGIEA